MVKRNSLINTLSTTKWSTHSHKSLELAMKAAETHLRKTGAPSHIISRTGTLLATIR